MKKRSTHRTRRSEILFIDKEGMNKLVRKAPVEDTGNEDFLFADGEAFLFADETVFEYSGI